MASSAVEPDDSFARRSLAARFPQRATSWRLARRRLALPRRPLLMGIVNVTPDSFSDGGDFLEPQVAIEHGLQLVQDGAAILDVGGESTRPLAQPVACDEELRRVIPVIRGLADQTDVPISIDTSKAAVAAQAIQAGAEIINDVTALTGDAGMIAVAAQAQCGICAMHMLGNPQTMQDNPTYEHVSAEIMAYLADRRDSLIEKGIDAERICLDPGLGFGKSHDHNITLISQIGDFHQLGQPLLVGHSRKGFLGKLLGDKHLDRRYVTAGVAMAMAADGVQIIRVHDVSAVRQTLLGFDAVGGIDGVDGVETSS